MPLDQLRIGFFDQVSRREYLLPVEWVVGSAVVVVVLEAATDLEMMMAGDGNVALVEEAVNVGTQEQAVGDGVLPSFGVGFDMGGLKHGQGMLVGDGTGSLVGIGDTDPEAALAKARAGENGFSVTFAFGFLSIDLPEGLHDLALFQDPATFSLGQIVSLALHEIGVPVSWLRDPLLFGKKNWIRYYQTADLDLGIQLHFSILLDAAAHGRKVEGSVGRAERLPGQPGREDVVAKEGSIPGDRVVRALQFEEKEFTRLDGTEPPTAGRLPEIDLSQIRALQQELIPVVIGIADVSVHECG